MMQNNYRTKTLKIIASVLLVAAIASAAKSLSAQEGTATPASTTKTEAPEPKPVASPRRDGAHPFWDNTNGWLFAGVAASRTFDYFSTLNMRRRGRDEILLTNDAVDNHAAFVAIEAAGTGVAIGAAYLFHRSGHHKLERWTSIVHMGLANTGAVRNYCLKTRH